MKIRFIGDSHAPKTLMAAAVINGFEITDDPFADLVFISQDTPTAADGKRDTSAIKAVVLKAFEDSNWHGCLVLTSQVEPGFTRSLGTKRLYYMAETLRIKDAMERAILPEQFIIGADYRGRYIPDALQTYMDAHKGAVVHRMTYEEAEFAKIAINMTLASQVENTNRLEKAANIVGADWSIVSKALASDKRIGPHSYLTPGRWQDSSHLLRDHVTLEEILAR